VSSTFVVHVGQATVTPRGISTATFIEFFTDNRLPVQASKNRLLPGFLAQEHRCFCRGGQA
jgi:hypothetical protein